MSGARDLSDFWMFLHPCPSSSAQFTSSVNLSPYAICLVLSELLTLQSLHLVCSSCVSFCGESPTMSHHVSGTPQRLWMFVIVIVSPSFYLLNWQTSLYFSVLIQRPYALRVIVFSQVEIYLLPVIVSMTTIAAVNRYFRFWY